MRDRESYFINRVSRESRSFIGDDGVLLDGIIVSSDSFFENIHFKRSWMGPKEAAIKSMLVNISDTIVMNATPKYAILNVAIPDYFTAKDIDELASGFLEVAATYNLKIVGGDTIKSKSLDISVTILATPRKKITYREGLKKGDVVYHTATLGQSKKELRRLQHGQKIRKDSKMIRPKIHQKFFYEGAKFFTAAMDISDGLYFELGRLAKINRVGFKLEYNLPKHIACSGEEYEVLFSIKPKDRLALKRVAAKNRIPLRRVGVARRGSFFCRCKPHHG